jgi:hypothetical protein
MAFLPAALLKELVGADADLLFHPLLRPLELTRLRLCVPQILNDRRDLSF